MRNELAIALYLSSSEFVETLRDIKFNEDILGWSRQTMPVNLTWGVRSWQLCKAEFQIVESILEVYANKTYSGSYSKLPKQPSSSESTGGEVNTPLVAFFLSVLRITKSSILLGSQPFTYSGIQVFRYVAQFSFLFAGNGWTCLEGS